MKEREWDREKPRGAKVQVDHGRVPPSLTGGDGREREAERELAQCQRYRGNGVQARWPPDQAWLQLVALPGSVSQYQLTAINSELNEQTRSDTIKTTRPATLY